MSHAFDPYREWLGVDASLSQRGHYELLGLPPLVEDDERIWQAAQRQMARLRAHESGPHAEIAKRLSSELSLARDVLTDPAEVGIRFQLARGSWSFHGQARDARPDSRRY